MTRARFTPILLFAALLGSALFARSASAQLVPGTPYQITRAPNTYQPLPNPTNIWTDVDDGQSPVTLPFPLTFYNTTFTSISVGANGAIGFPGGVSVPLGNRVPGTSGNPAGVVALYWTDLRLYAAAGRYIGYQVQGNAPNRTFTVEYRNIQFFSNTSANMSMQVRFFEGPSGRIEIDYDTLVGTRSGVVMGMDNPMNQQPIFFAQSGCTSCTQADWPTSTRITVTQDPGVELVASAVQAPPRGFLGAQTTVPITVQSLHGTPIGPFSVNVIASQTQNLANPVVIGTTSMTLGAFEGRTTDVVTVPPPSLGTGQKYLGIVVDPNDAIAEVDETNNTIASDSTIRLIVGLPDIAVRRVRVSTPQVDAGDTFEVYTTVQNVGGEPAANADVGLMLSSNPVISRQDVLLDTYTVSLAAGETVTTTRTVSIDAATNSGTYFVGAYADYSATIEELSESNNGLADINELTIAGGALAVATTRLPSAYEGISYSATLFSTGGEPGARNWEITEGKLPTGLDIVPATGEIYGRPTTPETQTFTVMVTSGNESATRQLMLTVADPSEPLTIVTRSLAAGIVGQEYSFAIVATGHTETSSLTWSTEGFPEGFAVNELGVLVGTPTEASTAMVTISVTDGTQSASREMELTIRDNANLLLVPRLLSTARFNEPYSEQLEATGGNPPLTFIKGDIGQLPPGLMLSTDGEISGTPTVIGRYRFEIEARDSGIGPGAASDTNTFIIDVIDTDGFSITTQSLPEGVVDEGYETTLEASGGLAPYEWKIREGRLPEGLLGNTDSESKFQIRGQPMESGLTSLLIEVHDSQGRTAVRAFGLSVLATAPVPLDTKMDDEGCSCATTSSRGAGLGWAVAGLLGVALILRRRR